MKLKISNPPFTGQSYRPRSHIVREDKNMAICGFKPKEGWAISINENIENVECLNCLRTYIRYFENLFDFKSHKGWNERVIQPPMSMNKIYWCSIGYRPEDVAKGNCKQNDKYDHGCHDCPDWKLMTIEEIEAIPHAST